MRPRFSMILAALLAAALSGGCGLLKMPDLSRTTAIARLRAPQRPLILIHGFLGSKLRDSETHKIAWGTMGNILTGGPREELALAMGGHRADVPGERLEAYQIYDSLWGVDYYSKIVKSIRTAGGYRIGDIDDPKPGDNAFVFVYDWRRDNAESARRLAASIDRLKKALGQPDVQFDILAHSQGGLIARYYVKYGGADLADVGTPPMPTMTGAANVSNIILIGTPNRGCLEALKILHLGVKKVFRPMRPEVVFTMPSVYQMLPPRSAGLFADLEGRPLDLDLYDPDTWVRQAWSAFSPEAQDRIRRKLMGNEDNTTLEEYNRLLRDFLGRSLLRAERFHEALNAPAMGEPGVAYYAFGGDCKATLKTAIVTKRHGEPGILFNPRRIHTEWKSRRLSGILFGPGDGTVLMQSLLALPGDPSGPLGVDEPGAVPFNSTFFVCENHGLLTNNPIFQNNLLYILLRPADRRPASGQAHRLIHEPPSVEAAPAGTGWELSR